VLAVFATALTVKTFAPPQDTKALKDALAGVWVFAEVFLFTLTGAALAYHGKTGPRNSDRGIDSTGVTDIVEILALGTLGRSTAIFLIQIICLPTVASHRRRPLYMLAWWITTWMCQIPKATVQAALGGLPYQQHLIPGAIGLEKGQFIARGTAFAVLLCAPIGVFLTFIIGYPLAHYLKRQDVNAGLDTDEKKPPPPDQPPVLPS